MSLVARAVIGRAVSEQRAIPMMLSAGAGWSAEREQLHVTIAG
jgi:hypothetical protein